MDATLQAASEAADARIAALEQRLAERPAPVPAAPAAPSAPSAPTTAARAPTAADAPAQAAPAAPGFVVILASLPTRAQAERELATQRDKGIAAILRESRIDGQTWYRVQVEGYRERAAAAAYVRELATRHGIRNAWVAAAR
jgi:cell division septation protein DedD